MLNLERKEHTFDKATVQSFINSHIHTLRYEKKKVEDFEISDELWHEVKANPMTRFLFEQTASAEIMQDTARKAMHDAWSMTDEDQNRDMADFKPYVLLANQSHTFWKNAYNILIEIEHIFYDWLTLFNAEKHKELFKTGEGKEWIVNQMNAAEKDLMNERFKHFA